MTKHLAALAHMSKRRPILVSVALVAVGLLWYLFRPDALVISRTVKEPFPTTQESASMMRAPVMGVSDEAPARIVAGTFHSNAHETKGSATIYLLDNGRRVLRLTEFSTSNGPDVRVYLVAAADVQKEDAAKRAGFVDLGALKGNVGEQNYDVPEALDLSKYRSVSIWCRRFSVNFGAAPLTESM